MCVTAVRDEDFEDGVRRERSCLVKFLTINFIAQYQLTENSCLRRTKRVKFTHERVLNI